VRALQVSIDEDGMSSSAASIEGIDVPGLLENVLQNDLQPADVHPFVSGRALWIAAKLGAHLPDNQAFPLLDAAVTGLGASNQVRIQSL
jgi:hypothetical protein